MTVIDNLWDASEVGWQLRRPRKFWTPLPAAGDRVFYRHRHFGDVTGALVEQIEDLDDTSDSYVWHLVTVAGQLVRDELGRTVPRRVPDPWVTLRLRTDWGLLISREARLRGSAGWLPPDWERRLYPAIIDGRFTFRRQTQMEASR